MLLDEIAKLKKIAHLKTVLDAESRAAHFIEGQLSELKTLVHNQVADLYTGGVIDGGTAAGMMLLFGTDDYASRSDANLRHRQRSQVAVTRAAITHQYGRMVLGAQKSIIFEQLVPTTNKAPEEKNTILSSALSSIQRSGTRVERVKNEKGQNTSRIKTIEPAPELAHSLLLIETARILPIMYPQD